MEIVSSKAIIEFFNKLNVSKIDYILVRNITSELPGALKIGKDIDLLVKYRDRVNIAGFLKENRFKKLRHPFRDDLYLYGVNPFEKFINSENVLIDLNYQLACRSLNAGEWIPLDRKIQDSAWGKKIFTDKNGLCSFRLCAEDEFVILVARSVFDKRAFDKPYINEIRESLKYVNVQNVISKLELIFFKYAKILMNQIQDNNYDSIVENYLSFRGY